MKKNILYLDMDGVVADFAVGAGKITGRTIVDPVIYHSPEEWTKVRAHGRIFRDLPKMKQADDMVDLAKKWSTTFDWPLIFLTALPHNNDIPWAIWDKIHWAEKYYPGIPVHFGPYSRDKKDHCMPGDILIDDRPDNCTSWTAAGGIAIQVDYNNYQNALNEFERMFEKKMSLKRLAAM